MDQNEWSEDKRRSLRLVQILTLLTGFIFVIAAVVMFIIGGNDIESEMALIALVLLLVGFGDFVIAFFVFRKASEVNIVRDGDTDDTF